MSRTQQLVIHINITVMDIAYELLGCRFFLQTWALDPGRVKDRALQQLASQLLDFSILHGCRGVLKQSCFLYVNLSDFAPRRPGRALLGSSGASRHWLPQAPASMLKS